MNASDTTTGQTTTFATAPQIGCPEWCVRHHLMDLGTPDAVVVHMAQQRVIEGVDVGLQQTEFADGHREQPFLYVDDEEMSVSAAMRFAAGLLGVISKATDV